jgi:hypothetical protein
MESERQRIAAITPFNSARDEAIAVVRDWTRGYLAAEARSRDIVDLSDSTLNSPVEQAAIDAIRAAFGAFLTAANAASNLAQLNTAWTDYRTAIAQV